MSMTVAQAQDFAAQWLPAWSGNRPELLAGFYSEDCFYLDPDNPLGIRGNAALLTYLRKLLAYNPKWIWTQIEAIPMQDGFLNKWRADIPVGSKVITEIGVCLVQFDTDGKIKRNEVYFDRSVLLAEIGLSPRSSRDLANGGKVGPHTI